MFLRTFLALLVLLAATSYLPRYPLSLPPLLTLCTSFAGGAAAHRRILLPVQPRPHQRATLLPRSSSEQLRPSASSPESSPLPWDLALRLSTCNESEYRGLVRPLSRIVANTYTFPRLSPVDGWVLSLRVLPLSGPLGMGAHALVYEEESARTQDPSRPRLVVAFRGTQASWPPGPSSLCDLCADALLFRDLDQQGLPPPCLLLPPQLIDYHAQALLYLRQVLSEYGFQNQILLSGHSLGGALAIMAASELNASMPMPVVSFAAGGVRHAMERRSIPLPPSGSPWAHDILDMWDPFFQTHPTSHVGTLCLYTPPQPEACKLCYGPRTPQGSPTIPRGRKAWFSAWSTSRGEGSTNVLETLWRCVVEIAFVLGFWPLKAMEILGFSHGLVPHYFCSKCFFAAHYYRHLLDLIQNFPRPECRPSPGR